MGEPCHFSLSTCNQDQYSLVQKYSFRTLMVEQREKNHMPSGLLVPVNIEIVSSLV